MCILCGAPTVHTKLTTPPINTVRPASLNRWMFNYSCHRHVYGNILVYNANSFMIALCIRSIFPQIIRDKNILTEVLSHKRSPNPVTETMFIKSGNHVEAVLLNSCCKQDRFFEMLKMHFSCNCALLFLFYDTFNFFSISF